MEQENKKEASSYDFVHPGHKLNKQWPVLDLVNARIATAFGTSLGDRLQIPLIGQAVQTTRSKYMDSVRSIGPTGIVHELSLSPLEGVIWFCMDTSVVSALVDSYFGGKAEVIPLEKPRELSRTEKRVMQHIVDAVLAAMTDGWSMVLKGNAALVRPIDVGRLNNAPLEQVMVTSDLKLQLGELELPCQLVYQFETLKPLSEQLEHEPTTTSKQDHAFSEALRTELMRCELDIRGVLSESRITLGKLLELKAGDFIPLRDVQTVSFKTQQMPLFDARVGSSNGRVSASLSRWHLPNGH
ncbi:FliM/FliN family flagellar motor switch protein [Granulosicoccus antarcticus]|uniref:Flagellar motor switch protein FliM n=1 Tax=Granulosicoccus antarcticus IMCC3135 TaxID=1192854 RepID=A0A2Z2NSR8_9GAMM|nr:FliM/FliN family flagellar motor switch protein [Granulosicoccus antarcticus]ASJ71780.1 Flagellar motor switch protein FliM [Granulosicoccus antarcticus IMCC3135]